MPENLTEKRADRVLPLVIYKGGERIVIGSAYLKGDGSIEAQIAKDVRQDLKDMIFGDRVGDFSLNPVPVIAPDASRKIIGHIPHNTNVQDLSPLKPQEP